MIIMRGAHIVLVSTVHMLEKWVKFRDRREQRDEKSSKKSEIQYTVL